MAIATNGSCSLLRVERTAENNSAFSSSSAEGGDGSGSRSCCAISGFAGQGECVPQEFVKSPARLFRLGIPCPRNKLFQDGRFVAQSALQLASARAAGGQVCCGHCQLVCGPSQAFQDMGAWEKFRCLVKLWGVSAKGATNAPLGVGRLARDRDDINGVSFSCAGSRGEVEMMNVCLDLQTRWTLLKKREERIQTRPSPEVPTLKCFPALSPFPSPLPQTDETPHPSSHSSFGKASIFVPVCDARARAPPLTSQPPCPSPHAPFTHSISISASPPHHTARRISARSAGSSYNPGQR